MSVEYKIYPPPEAHLRYSKALTKIMHPLKAARRWSRRYSITKTNTTRTLTFDVVVNHLDTTTMEGSAHKSCETSTSSHHYSSLFPLPKEPTPIPSQTNPDTKVNLHQDSNPPPPQHQKKGHATKPFAERKWYLHANHIPLKAKPNTVRRVERTVQECN